MTGSSNFQQFEKKYISVGLIPSEFYLIQNYHFFSSVLIKSISRAFLGSVSFHIEARDKVIDKFVLVLVFIILNGKKYNAYHKRYVVFIQVLILGSKNWD